MKLNKLINQKMVGSVKYWLPILVLLLVAGLASRQLINLNQKQLVMGDIYSCSSTSCSGHSGCSDQGHQCTFSSDGGYGTGSCKYSWWCKCSGDSCVYDWSCLGSNMKCNLSSCPEGATCSTGRIHCESCGNSGKDCQKLTSDPVIIDPTRDPDDITPPSQINRYYTIFGSKLCVDGTKCSSTSGCYCPENTKISLSSEETLATSPPPPDYSVYLNTDFTNIMSANPAGNAAIYYSSQELGKNVTPTPPLGLYSSVYSSGNPPEIGQENKYDNSFYVNFQYDVRSYVWGRVQDNTTKLTPYPQQRMEIVCHDTRPANTSLPVHTQNVSWSADTTGPYFASAGKTAVANGFYRGQTITCNLSNPPAGYLFSNWQVDNKHNDTSNWCSPDRSGVPICTATFTADQGDTGAGDNQFNIRLVTPTPYLVVNIKSPDNKEVTVKTIYQIQCSALGCSAYKFYSDVKTKSFPKEPGTYYAFGSQIVLKDSTNNTLVVQGVTPSPAANFTRQQVAMLMTTPTPATSLARAQQVLKNAVIRQTLAQETEEPVSDQFLWTDADDWDTGGRILDVVVITPAIKGQIYGEDASQGGSQDIVCLADDGLPDTYANVDGKIIATSGEETKTITLDNQSSYSVSVDKQCSPQGCYNVDLSLPTPGSGATTAYACACSAVEDDNFTCRYLDQPAPGQNVNFFVRQYGGLDSTNAWWQAIGGSLAAVNGITSLIPDSDDCDGDCQPALILNDLADTTDSPGFPFSATLKTSESSGDFIHLSSERTNARQAKSTGMNLTKLGYDYYLAKLGSLNRGDLPPDGSKPALESGINVFQHAGDLTFGDDETKGDRWTVAAGEKIVVLVQGNLTITDQDSDDETTNQIFKVDNGGFLAFVVSGDIIINPTVGEKVPTFFSPVVFANPLTTDPHLEGVFIADGRLQIPSLNPNPAAEIQFADRKLILAGTYVGWTGVNIARNFQQTYSLYSLYNLLNPTTTFIFRPDLVLNLPTEMKEAQLEWQEIAPEWEE